MECGDLLGERFELDRPVASGGMGQVFHAHDRWTGSAVAVKVMLESRAFGNARFEREIAVLSELSHPGIVRHVAHGVTPRGAPYLVMEWLNGEDLCSRLKRGPLALGDTLALGMQVCAALAIAHRTGVVHRDLKPSNLWLCDGDARRVKVLDFGVAHLGDSSTVTRTGCVLGTPRYMAPEQAKGERSIDPRADVFALGCVLFECLAGEPPFSGDSIMAVLAKILFQEAPRLVDLLPQTPPELDNLVARALSKLKVERPNDGAALLQELAAITPNDVLAREVSTPRRASLTASERRMQSVVLIAVGKTPGKDASTVDSAGPDNQVHQLQRIVSARAGRLELLAEGTAVITFTRSGRVASDQAVQAARCALGVNALGLGLPIVVATGRTEITGLLPLGDAIDRASRMLAARVPDAIQIDAVTAGLLDTRFDVQVRGTSLTLRAEHDLPKGTRTLLGKPTTCVGRDWELSTLEQLLGESMDESVARAVLVTAPAGMGKSRFAVELVKRLRAERPRLQLWAARADTLRSGSALNLLGQAVRDAIGLHESERLSVRQEQLRAYIDERFGLEERQRISVFLGELTGTPFSDQADPRLQAARRDSQVMGEQMLRAWLEFVTVETATRPVLLVLEDLHWGDMPTVRFLDVALRELSQRPLMVLALARPEVHELFPKLWADRRMQEIRLKELSRKACEGLVRQVLGENLSAGTLERLIVQAEGHAFYLEELIRAVAEGDSVELPETVLAMVQARLAALDPETRRVLRAASVFGEVSWRSGIAALLGESMQTHETSDRLKQLVEHELLVARVGSRFAGDTEYAFRHALLREGAYAMLTEGDQALGHKLTGEWLEQRGESDAGVLAEHFERGRVPEKASLYYLRAAQRAGRAGDPDAAISRARRGLALGVEGEAAGALHALLVEALIWQGEWKLADVHAEQAVRLAAPDTVPRVTAAAGRFVAALTLGLPPEVMAARTRDGLHILESTPKTLETAAFCARSSATVAFGVELLGQFDVACAHIEKMRSMLEPLADQDALMAAWLAMPHTYHAGMVADDALQALKRAKLAHSLFQRAGHSRGGAVAQSFIGINAYLLGAHAEAEEVFRRTHGVRLAHVSALRCFFSVANQIELRSMAAAEEEAQQLIALSVRAHAGADEGRGHAALARVLLARGAFEQAQQAACRAVALLARLPTELLHAQASLVQILLGAQRPEALDAAEVANSQHAALQTRGYDGPLSRLVSLVYAEALAAAGRHVEARDALRRGRDRVYVAAAKIDDSAYRLSFLERVQENARILTLAREWLA